MVTISEQAELLAMLNSDPTRRFVGYPDEENKAVCEGEVGGRGRVLAWIEESGSASELLDKAYDADCNEDISAWVELPIRYGPSCSTWVLPDHPKAPTRPGAGDE